jgi:hypothetical protein
MLLQRANRASVESEELLGREGDGGRGQMDQELLLLRCHDRPAIDKV